MTKTCEDYTLEDRHNDYIRHRREGTKPCQAALQAWRYRQRKVRDRLRAETVNR